MVGPPFFPYFLLKGQAWFFFIFGALVLLATFAQINPIWLYGPYSPLAISSGSQPDFYMGLLEGSLRMMPAWEINFLGHTVTFSVLIPALVPLGLLFTGAALWPFFEQWATGDRSFHNINDRPRNAPVRTAVGVGVVAWYGVLWLEGANDLIADRFDVPLYTITWIARVLFFVAPAVGYVVTKRICLGLQRKDANMLVHGVEIGIIRQLPDGGFVEEERPVTEEERGYLESSSSPGAARAGAGGRQRRARPGRPRPARRGPRVRQPGLHRDHRDPRRPRQRARQRQRPCHQRQRQRARRRTATATVTPRSTVTTR